MNEEQTIQQKSIYLNAKGVAALKDSIEHWRRMETGNYRDEREAPDGEHCALCNLFMRPSAPAPFPVKYYCVGCPVWQDTGSRMCDGSPFKDANEAYCRESRDSIEFQSLAKVEREYLESLLARTICSESKSSNPNSV